MDKNIWAVLRIKPTSDEKQIRKAYAARSKEIHPEEKPEEFKELYQAYKTALAYAKVLKGKKKTIDVPVTGEDGILKEEEQKKEKSEEELEKEKTRNKKTKEEKAQNEKPKEEKAQNEKPENKTPNLNKGDERLLIKHFSGELKRKKFLMEQLRRQWEKVRAVYEENDFWQEYLASEDFKEIQWSAEALDFLAEETEKYAKTRYNTPQNDPLVALWKAYGFPENRQIPQVKRIYDNIYPAFLFWQKKQDALQEKERAKKKQRLLWLFIAALFCFVFAIIISTEYTGYTEGRRYMERYMKETYPHVAFSKPKKEKTAVYTFHSETHPEITVTAAVTEEKGYYEVKEDYGTQLLEYYSARHGAKLKWDFVKGSGRKKLKESEANKDTIGVWDFGEGSGRALFAEGRYVAYYENVEEAEAFCTAIVEMFEKEEELDFAKSFGICAADARYPISMLEGGETGFPRPQHYVAEQLAGGEELAASVKEGYVDYMYNYEPWNLSEEQKRAWGITYCERGRKWEEENKGYREEKVTRRVTVGSESKVFTTCEVYFRGSSVPEVEKVEMEQDLYIPVYRFGDYYEVLLRGNVERYLSVGNAYQLLEGMGMDVKKDESGDGFIVRDWQGNLYSFGENAEVKLDEVLALIK